MDGAPPPPRKLYYRIGEVAQLVGVQPHVLRYWESEFRAIRPQKSPKGQRVYSQRDVKTLLTVRDLLYGHGFTIQGARRKLRDGGLEPPDPEAARSAETIRARLQEIRGEIVTLLDELERL